MTNKRQYFWEKKTVKNDKAVYQFLRQILAIFWANFRQ